ncbi:hypothetical protein CcaverHIS002_0208880 [Cutaneotrichosporon cavernicola]|nr:hypothetical protein CcaverHIS002_0208880 [Cutaneotrichosporon cavernicola]
MSERPAGDDAMATGAIEALLNGTGTPTSLSSAIVALAAEHSKTIELAHTLFTLITSTLSADAIVAVLKETLESLGGDEERLEALATAILETVDAIKVVGDDVEDLVKNDAGCVNTESAEKASTVVNSLVQNGALPQHLANLILAPANLVPLRLHPTPRNVDMFRRGLARLNTSVHYKQHTSNLLRENSEGWSRLIVLLTGPVALYDEPESDEERVLRAKRVWTSVRELVGFFSLAPVRVYDLILEVASCHVEKHWRFLLDLLRQAGLGPEESPAPRLDEDTAAQVQRIAHVLDVNPDDDTMIARVLAFRFRWYRRKKIGGVPVSYMFLTALLIKYGFAKPGHLLPALSPNDEQMDKINKRFGDAMRSKSNARNALTDTVLVDDTLPDAGAATPGAPVEDQEKTDETEQKIELLQALLAIGESTFSIYLLALYPWVISAYPAIADVIIRNLRLSIGDLYTRTVVLSGVGDNVDLVSHNPDVVLTTLCPTPPSTLSTEWLFFYDKWMDGIEVWTEVEHVYTKGERWFALLRGLGGRDSELMVCVCRIISTQFRQLRLAKIQEKGFDITHRTHDQRAQLFITAKELSPWRGLIRNTILPALNISEFASAPFALEVHEIFAHFDWPTTTNLFGEWRDSTTNTRERNALLPAAHAANQAARDVKMELQRVTASSSAPGQSTGGATADRGPARALAKHGHGNPFALWTRGNGQVMSYGIVGNIGEFFMEVARYSGPLSKEVAVFTWVDMLASIKENAGDSNESRFLKARNIENLSTFVGIINRQFNFPLEPILNLIASGIKNHEWFVLPLVEKFLTGMTGEDIVENHAISTAQLKNYATGPEMTRESFYVSENTCSEDRKPVRSKDLIQFSKKSSTRLVKALADTRLAVPILVGLGRLATETLLYEPGRPIKAMSDQKDATRDVFSLWCGFVADKLADLGCADQIPSLRELQGDGNIDEQMCWAILRPKLRAALAKERLENGHANGIDMVVDDPNGGWWPAALNETVQHAASFLDPGARIRLGPGFLVRFNSMRISDIAFNEEAYTGALSNIAKVIRQLESLVATGKNTKNSQQELDRLKRRNADLEAEKASQKLQVERIRTVLKDESQHWFAKCIEMGQDGALPNLLHDYCFYLRATQTPADAIFVARFIRLLHDLDTPGFSTIHGYNLFFKDSMASKLYESTESEARNLGRALLLMLEDLHPWHQSQDKYKTEALGMTQNAEGAAVYSKHGMFYRVKPGQPKRPMIYDGFRDQFAKMHAGLTNALLTCWSSDDMFYAPKNALQIALQVLPFFPMIEEHAVKIEKAVNGLLQKTDGSITPDMKPALNSYKSQLARRRKERPCITEADFSPAGKRKKEVQAKAAAEARAKAEEEERIKKEEAQAKAGEESPSKAERDAADAKMEVDPSADAKPETKAAVTPLTSTPSSGSDAKALRAKLELAREAKKAAAASAGAEASTSPQPQSQAGPSAPTDRTMAPPPEPSIEDARAAARARRFGALAPSASSAPGTPRNESRASTPRATTPPGRTRAGTDDSRVSERSRRQEDRDRRDRDRGRDGSNRDRRDRGGREREGRREEREDRTPRDGHEPRDRDRRLEPRDEPMRDSRGREERYREEHRPDERPRARSRDEGHRDGRDKDSRDGRDGRERDRRRDERPSENAGPAPIEETRAEGPRESRDARSPHRPVSRNEDRPPQRPTSRNEDRPMPRNERRPDDRDLRGGRDRRDARDTQPGPNQLSPLPRDVPPHRDDRRGGMRSPQRFGERRERRDDRRPERDERRGDDRRRRDEPRRDEPPRRDEHPQPRERDGDRTPHGGRDTPKESREPPTGPSGSRSPRKDDRSVGNRSPRKDDAPRSGLLSHDAHPRPERFAPPARASPSRQLEPAQPAGQPQPPARGRRDPPTGPSGLPSRPRDMPERGRRPDAPSAELNRSPTRPDAPLPAPPAREPPAPRQPQPGRDPLPPRPREPRRNLSDRGHDQGGRGQRELIPPTAAGGSLMARMGLTSAPVPKPEKDSRKRPLDTEGAPSSREGSPGGKRRARGSRDRQGGGNRLFSGAMQAARRPRASTRHGNMSFFQSLSSMFGRAPPRPASQDSFQLPTTQYTQGLNPSGAGPDSTPGPSRRTSFQPQAGQYPQKSAQQHPPLSHTFHRLRNALVDDFPELIDSLNGPVSQAVIAGIEQELGGPLPQAVREYFLVTDGQDLEVNGVGLFYGLYLLPLDEVMREWHFWRQAEADPSTGSNPAILATMASIPPQWVKSLYACKGWLPLLSDRSGNYVGVDLDPGPQGQWGQAIIFGRDFDRKCVLWRGEGESGWAKWVSSIVEEFESHEGWEVDKTSDDEEEIGYSSYSGANMYGDRGHSMRLAGEYKGWNVLEAWWDKSVRKWEGLGLGMDVTEIERGLAEARRLQDESSKGKGKESARNSVEVAGIRANQRTADDEIPMLTEVAASPEHSPAIPQEGDDSQTLLPHASREVSAIPRILHPKGTPSRMKTTNHPLESPTPGSPTPSGTSNQGTDYLVPPSHRSSSNRQQQRRSRPPPPAAVLDLPTRADVQAAQAVANAEARGMRGGWVMSLDASSGVTNRRKTHNISPSLSTPRWSTLTSRVGEWRGFGTPPMSAIEEEKQSHEDKLSMAPIEQRRDTRSPSLLGMSRTPSPFAPQSTPPQTRPPSRPGSNANSPPQPQRQGSGSQRLPSSSSSSEAHGRGPALVSPIATPPLRTPSPSGLPPDLAAVAEAAIRRPEPVVGYRSVSPVPDGDWLEHEVIRGVSDRRRSSTTPIPSGVATPSRGDSTMSVDSEGALLGDKAESQNRGSTMSHPPNGHAATPTTTTFPKRKSDIAEVLEEVSLG